MDAVTIAVAEGKVPICLEPTEFLLAIVFTTEVEIVVATDVSGTTNSYSELV